MIVTHHEQLAVETSLKTENKTNLAELILHESYLDNEGRSLNSNCFFNDVIGVTQVKAKKENNPQLSIVAGTFLLNTVRFLLALQLAPF